MNDVPSQRGSRFQIAAGGVIGWVLRSWGRNVALALLGSILTAQGDENFSKLVAQGEATTPNGNLAAALKYWAAADQVAGTNCAELCQLTKCYCDRMHDERSPDRQKELAKLALAEALRAERADPRCATAHLCVAVGYVKNFPWAPNATKVAWSKAIKTECETALALDPRADVGYYLLGRWEFEVANMNFFVKHLASAIYGALPAASNAEAVQDFLKAIALAPRRIIHHAELARVYAAMGKTGLAATELKTCASLTPVDRDDRDAQVEAAQRLAALEHGHAAK